MPNMKSTVAGLLVALTMALPAPAGANENIADQYPDSLLYSAPVEVIPHVWSAIGATAPPTYENAGHNNNLSFIVTGDGVIVVNGGGSYGLAEALHKEIKSITDQPVKLVVNENGQGHAALGNCYWAEQGVKIVAHEDAAKEFEKQSGQILQAAERILKDRAAKTCIHVPDETFSDRMDVSMGSMKVELIYSGPAHSHGDTQVWLPEEKLVIAGDIAFHERMPPIFDDTDTAAWIDTWENAFEKLGAVYVVPGHGHPTNMAQVRRYTHDYLVYLRGKIKEMIDEGKGLDEAFYVDQSPYKHLHTFEELATRNAGRVFQQMEFE